MNGGERERERSDGIEREKKKERERAHEISFITVTLILTISFNSLSFSLRFLGARLLAKPLIAFEPSEFFNTTQGGLRNYRSRKLVEKLEKLGRNKC